jgi:organic radical activating enzyme
MSQVPELPQRIFKGPKTLSIQPTFQCTAHCADCGTYSSPWDRNSIPWEIIAASIDQAKELGFFNVVFTGGEATLKWDLLLRGIAYAHEKGFPVRVVTNAFWAANPRKAQEKVDALLAAGLDEINYSTGDEHCKYVPVTNIVNAVEAAMNRKLRTHIMVEMRDEMKVTKASLLADPRMAAANEANPGLLSIGESPWMPVDPDRVQKYPEGVATNRKNLPMMRGCDSVLQTYVVQSDGRVGSCCGLGLRMTPELNVARTDEKDFLAKAVEEAEADFLKLWIRYVGVEKILAWAAEKDPSIVWEDMYAHRCQACMRLYRDPVIAEVIREHYTEMIRQVLQDIWLDQEFIPQQLAPVPRGPDVEARTPESVGAR